MCAGVYLTTNHCALLITYFEQVQESQRVFLTSLELFSDSSDSVMNVK